MKICLTSLLVSIGLFLSSQDFSKNKIPCEPVVYPIQFYLIYNHPLTGQRNTSFLHRIKDSLNTYFKPTCIQFQICKIDTIIDYNYFDIFDVADNNTIEVDDIRAMHYNPKAINFYWVSSGQISSFRGICDSKYRKPYIVSSMVAFSPPNIPTSQTELAVHFYRYFGLHYTQSTPASREFVNKVNGQVTADFIWDSPADPLGLNFSAPDTFYPPKSLPGLNYLYTNRKDPNGDFYNPMVYNAMSQYAIPEKLPTNLTHEQYQRIVATERQCRKRFWGLE